MGNKLFVGGISYNTSDAALRDAFSQAGQVTSVQLIIDRMTGRPKGFGFVEMASSEDAQKAIDLWNGKELDGRRLLVNEARPKEDRPRGDRPSYGGGNRGGYGGGNRGGYGGGRRDDRRGGRGGRGGFDQDPTGGRDW